MSVVSKGNKRQKKIKYFFYQELIKICLNISERSLLLYSVSAISSLIYFLTHTYHIYNISVYRNNNVFDLKTSLTANQISCLSSLNSSFSIEPRRISV